MISSMTGFSFHEEKINEGKLSIEIRTLNSRYFELQLRLSDELREFEQKIREIIASRILRGKVDCRIFFKVSDSINQIDKPIHKKQLRNLIKKIENLSGELKSPGSINPLHLFEIISNQQLSINHRLIRKDLFKYLNLGLDNVCKDRRREGKKIRIVILNNLKFIEKIIAQARKIMPKLIDNNLKNITKRLKENLIDASEDRIKQELLFFIQKSDINEELDRLESHIIELRRLLNIENPIGKKIDFLMQELNREANTIGSKAAGIFISNFSIDLKVNIEQIREQIQNIQ